MTVIIIIIGGSKGEDHQEGIDIKGQEPNDKKTRQTSSTMTSSIINHIFCAISQNLARTPCVPLFCTSFNRGGNRGAFRLPGAGGGSFPLYGGTFARSYSVSSVF